LGQAEKCDRVKQVLIPGVIETLDILQEEYEDTKGAIRICKSKDRQHNGQKKKDKRTNNVM
jgi:hypothetical protein